MPVLAVVATAVTAVPSIRLTALLGGIPMLLAIVVILMVGPEAGGKSLEKISAEELEHLPRPRADSLARG